jgi:hypothetical protein
MVTPSTTVVPLHLGQAAPAEGDVVVKHDVVPDLGRLPDHHAHAVVDEEAPPDRGPGMDLDPGDGPGPLRQQPGDQPMTTPPQGMTQPVRPDRMQAGIAQYQLGLAADCGIVVDGGLEVLLQAGRPAQPLPWPQLHPLPGVLVCAQHDRDQSIRSA